MSNQASNPIPQADRNHQQILAQHIYDLHEEVTKLAMQTWRSLRQESVTETQIKEAQEIIVRAEKRIQYMKNCCWWIQTELHDQAEAAKKKEEGHD